MSSWLSELIAPSPKPPTSTTTSTTSPEETSSSTTNNTTTKDETVRKLNFQNDSSTATQPAQQQTQPQQQSTKPIQMQKATSNASNSSIPAVETNVVKNVQRNNVTASSSTPASSSTTTTNPSISTSTQNNSKSNSNINNDNNTEQQYEVAELYRIIGFLERELNDRNTKLRQSQSVNAALQAQWEEAQSEISSLKRDRDRLRQHTIELQINVQSLSDQLRVELARTAGATNDIDNNFPSNIDASQSQSLPVEFYHQLARVENDLAAEQRANAELERENKNYKRLLQARERELLKLHQSTESLASSEPELAAMKQKLLDAQRNIDELTDENNTLLSVQRAKTRAIERLTAQLGEASELVLAGRDARTKLAGYQEALEACQGELARARVNEQRLLKQLEKLDARDPGIPTAIWHGERTTLLARTRAAEEETRKAVLRAEAAEAGVRRWSARWRRVADEAGRRGSSLAAVRGIVQKQRAAAVSSSSGRKAVARTLSSPASSKPDSNDTDDNDDSVKALLASPAIRGDLLPSPYASPAAARKTMDAVLNGK